MILHAYLRPAQLPDVHAVPHTLYSISSCLGSPLLVLWNQKTSSNHITPCKCQWPATVRKTFQTAASSRLCLHPVWQHKHSCGWHRVSCSWWAERGKTIVWLCTTGVCVLGNKLHTSNVWEMCHKAKMKPTCQHETLWVLSDDLTQELNTDLT